MIKIAVMTTKPYRMPEDSAYAPMLVGAALWQECGIEDPRLLRDDTGDNISVKNDKYCELTGLYWLWKNSDCDYFGCVHYRRLLGSKIHKFGHDPYSRLLETEEMQEIFKNHKLILPQKRVYYIETLLSHYQHTHDEKQLDVVRCQIEKQCPEYLPSFDKVIHKVSGYMYNIMVGRRDVMDAYFSWLFPILFAFEERIDDEKMTPFELRYIGRISEIIFNVWLDYQLEKGTIREDEICEVPLVYTEDVNRVRKYFKFLKAKFWGIKYSGR